MDKTCTSEFFKEHINSTSPKDECYLRCLKNSPVFIQISRETMLLRIKNIHKNVRDNCSFNLHLYSELSTDKVFLALLYHIILRLGNFLQTQVLGNSDFCTAVFEMNCTEIKQSQSSNIFMYIIR